jgi:GntR family transcriptional regulator, galactonate operon transcriptional repressor
MEDRSSLALHAATPPGPTALRGLHGKVVDELGQAIVSGRRAPDEILDAAELEASFGVSRTVVREALRVLAAKGLVDARPKRGTFVRPRSGWQLFDVDVLRWGFANATTSSLGDLAEVRRIVEPAIASLAAERRTEADLTQLDDALDLMAAARDSEAATTADVTFHRALALASHNELLAPIQEVILVGLQARDLVVHAAMPSDGALRLHTSVLDAVRAGDPAAAGQAMRELLDVAVLDVTSTVLSAAEAGP